jgi:hypothetical protein
MQVRGIVQSAELAEAPGGGEAVEMLLAVQGVRPGQPRRLVVPFELLLADESLEPEAVQGHGFVAEVEEEAPGRWVAREIAFGPGRVLRREE